MSRHDELLSPGLFRWSLRGWTSAALLSPLIAIGLVVVPAESGFFGSMSGGEAAAVASVAAGPTVVAAGTLTQSVTWSPDGSPYILDGVLRVDPGATLTILPGTVVKFVPTSESAQPTSYDNSGITIYGGRLVARGTGAAPIVFTSSHDDAAGGDTDGDGRAPTRGDWASIRFTASSEEVAAQMPTSVLENALIRYGGETSAIACHGSSMVAATSLSRVRVRRSELTDSLGPGLSIDVAALGLGVTQVSHSRFADSKCGIYAQSGAIFNNVFESSLDKYSLYGTFPASMQVYGNHFYSKAAFNGSGPSREQADVRGNYFDRGVADEPSGQDHQDLSENAWGQPQPVIGACYDPAIAYVPAVKWIYTGTACGPETPGLIADYFTKVVPMLASMPPVPEVGPGAAASAPGTVPWEQMLGGLGGSEYAYPAQGSMADPVATATGAYVEERVDAAVPTPGMGLAANRTYNSADPSVGWLGRGWHFGYEAWLDVTAPGSVVILHAEDGQQVRYNRQPDGSYGGGAGVTAKLSTEGDGWLVRTRAQLERRFGPAGRLLSITDANDNAVTLSYDQAGLLASVASAGRTLTFTNDAAGRITKVTLQDGRYVGYGYTNGMLTSVRDLAGRATTYDYDTTGRLTGKTSAAGLKVMRLAYDQTSGRVSDQWDALDQHTTFSWEPNSGTDPGAGTARMTDPRGHVWTDRYQGNLLMARTAPDGANTSYVYDADLQLLETDGPRGVLNEYTYNNAGDLVSTTTPSGTVTTVYDQRHRPIKSVNARGTRVDYEYDAHGNLSTIIRPDPANPGGVYEESFTYSDRGLLLTATGADGRTTTHTYTGAGDLASTAAPSGAKATFGYDQTGRLISSVDPRGNVAGADVAAFTTTYSYADDDQPLEVINQFGHKTRYTYDAVGHTKSVIDAKDRATTYTYDEADRITAMQGPDTAVGAAKYEYDANGNVLKETDTAGRAITYVYDSVNRMTKATTPLGVYVYAYDKAGNLTKITDPAKSTNMSYDLSNRLVKIDYPSGTSDVSYTYDVHGNRTKMTDSAGAVTYGYDKLDRLLTVTRGSSVFRYGYDQVGAITTMTYPDGTAYDYGYDQDHRLDTVTKAGAPLADYDYDAAGLPSRLTRGNNTTATYAHDQAGQLTRIQDTAPGGGSLLDESYTYDATGNLTGITGPNGQRTFTYDALDRLTAACYNTSTCSGATDYARWSYDAASNRTSETRPAGTTNYQYAAGTGLLTSTTGPGASSFAYDALGQLKTRTVAGGAITNYLYDAAGRVTRDAVTGGAITTYTYDGDGRRLTSATGGSTTAFGWNPASYQLATESTGGNVVRRYSYGLGPIGLERPGQTGADVFHLDRMGSVRAVTNPAAAKQWDNEWEPYGLARTAVKVDPAAGANPIGWTGQHADPTGQIHLRARQYDPTLGRFTAPDQAAAMSYSATGTYAAANPLTYTDPTGLWSITPGEAWEAVTNIAAVGGSVAAAVAPRASIYGIYSFASGAVTAGAGAYLANQACAGSGKGSCAAEVPLRSMLISAGVSAMPFGKMARGSKAEGANRVFWSGGDLAKNAAADFAKANGSKTLEMTLMGRALEKLPYNRFTAKLWDAASAAFAATARGEANVFIGPSFRGAASVFGRIEGPILQIKGNPILQQFLGGQ